jgi:outer membrane protein assembly factor BamB
LVEGKRCWFVSSRGEVLCLDTEGFHDGEDDGPQKAGWGRLFKEAPLLTTFLDADRLPEALQALLEEQGVSLIGRVGVTSLDLPENEWLLTVRGDENEYFRIRVDGKQLAVEPWSKDNAKATGDPIVQVPIELTAGLAAGQMSEALLALLSKRGMPISGDAQVKTIQPNRKWSIVAKVNGARREFELRREGPNVSAYKQITADDKYEADEIWVFDMMGELGISQHNMCSCSVTAWGDILFVNTSNGLDESHINIPAADAPSFIAMDKNTGKVLWTDGSPGLNILHGQWSSPTVGEMGGVVQAIFGGGDGWVYSFAANEGKDGKPELLWKFDANPKDSKWILGGRGTRNNIIATPVIYKERLFVAVGQDPEHGEGIGHLWCLDPTKRGDVSPQQVVHVNDRAKIVPHRRLQAMIAEDGEIAIDNPNSAVIWQYTQFDQNGDGEFDFEESMHRSCGTVAIKDDLLYISDFSGLFHCLDAMTGKVHWTYDMLAAAWGSPLIVDGKVYIGDEDGEVSVFRLTAEPHEPLAEINMLNSVYSTPIVSHNVMYISNRTHLFAIQKN